VKGFSLGHVKGELLRSVHCPNFAFYPEIIERSLDFGADFVKKEEEKDGFILVLIFLL
jgi:hypothetical protein